MGAGKLSSERERMSFGSMKRRNNQPLIVVHDMHKSIRIGDAIHACSNE